MVNSEARRLEGGVGAPAAKTRIRWIILGLLFALSFVAYVLRTNVSIAGESMRGDLGLSTLQLGMVMSAFAWAYGLFQIPGGIFGDVVGSHRALTLIAVAWGVLTLLTGLVPGPAVVSTSVILATLIALRFLMGATQAPIYPVSSGGTIANWFPVAGWAFPNGMTSTALTLGAAATGPLVAWMMLTVGWRASFFLTAPLAFLTAAVWRWYGRNTPAEHPSVGEEELAIIDANRVQWENRTQTETGGGASWWPALKNREVLLLTASYFCMNYVFYIFFNWFFIYLVDVRKFAVLESGFLASAPWMVGAVGATVGGLWCDRLSKRIGPRWGCRIPGIVGLSLVAGLLFLGATTTSPYLAVLYLSLCFGCTQITEGAYWAATISVAGRHAAAASGVLNTGGNVVGGIGALLVPVTAEAFGWVAALATGSVFAVLGAGLWLLVRADAELTD